MAAPSFSGITELRKLLRNDPEGCVTLYTSTGSNPTNLNVNSNIAPGGVFAYAINVSNVWTGPTNWVAVNISMPSVQDFSSDIIGFGLYTLSSTVPRFATRANGGLLFRAYSNSDRTEYRQWRLIGSDNYNDLVGDVIDSWLYFLIQISNSSHAETTTSGFDSSTIHSVEIRNSSSGGTAHALALNMLYKISPLVCVGGETATPGNYANVISYLASLFTNSQNYLYRNLGQDLYQQYVPLQVGNGTTETHFELPDKALNFLVPDLTADAYFLRIYNEEANRFAVNQSSLDSFSCSGSLLTSSYKWAIDLAGNSSASKLFSSSIIKGAGLFELDGFPLTQTTIKGCDRITATGGSIAGSIITESTDTVAFVWDGATVITGASFTNNNRAIEITMAGTYTLNSNTFEGNTYDFYVSATTETVRIEVDANSTTDIGSWESSYLSAGATVVFAVPSPTIQINVIFRGALPPLDYEWRLYLDDVTPGILGSVELAGNENETSTTLTYSVLNPGSNAIFQVIADGFIEDPQPFTLPSTNQEINIFVDADTNL